MKEKTVVLSMDAMVGAYIENAFVIDEAPTIARMFGDSMPQAEDRVMTELLAEGR